MINTGKKLSEEELEKLIKEKRRMEKAPKYTAMSALQQLLDEQRENEFDDSTACGYSPYCNLCEEQDVDNPCAKTYIKYLNDKTKIQRRLSNISVKKDGGNND